jgi:glutamyl-tRNA synthetase
MSAGVDRVRVRFAPSPSGHLHVGGARTALFNWLFARHHGGTFILRVEDTDARRSSIESIQAIVTALRWLSLAWDEGPDAGGPCAPYFQSERAEQYRTAARRLVDEDKAYPCYCTEEELEQARQEQQRAGQPLRYGGRCSGLSAAERHALAARGREPAIRFRVAREVVVVDDLVKGPVEFDATLYGDLVILRSSGQAMYNFACVIDDAAMRISHVVRGDEHLANTPKQMLLCRALGLPEPRFAHLPMILGKDREKLSKRHGHTSVGEFAERGYLPEAMVNYLSLLGWSPGQGQGDEVLAPAELVERFDLGGVVRNPAVFDGTKLDWLNQQHLKRKTPRELEALAAPFLTAAFGRVRPDPSVDDERFHAMLALVADALVVLPDVGSQMRVFFDEAIRPDEAALAALRAARRRAALLARLRAVLSAAPPAGPGWSRDAVKASIAGVGRELGVKGKDLFMPVRIATTGYAQGADLSATVWLLGRDRVVGNLARALELANR